MRLFIFFSRLQADIFVGAGDYMHAHRTSRAGIGLHPPPEIGERAFSIGSLCGLRVYDFDGAQRLVGQRVPFYLQLLQVFNTTVACGSVLAPSEQVMCRGDCVTYMCAFLDAVPH